MSSKLLNSIGTFDSIVATHENKIAEKEKNNQEKDIARKLLNILQGLVTKALFPSRSRAL